MTRIPRCASALFTLVAATSPVMACGGTSNLPEIQTIGTRPTLPEPNGSLLPTINVVEAIGWPDGATPVGAPGTTVTAFAKHLDHPRWVYVLPNGDVLVAETNAPPRPRDNTGIRGWFFKRFQKKAGGAAPTANRITLLRDTNNDGVADVRTVFAAHLNSPFGMALVGDHLYVANTDAIVRFPYVSGMASVTGAPERVIELPAGPRNHHWTKNIVASADGTKLYVSNGSNSNVAEHGMDEEQGRAEVWEVDPATRTHRVYGSGLRNPVGMTIEPTTKMLWVAVNERDELGNDLVPDYMTSVRDGGFYGWPYSYYGQYEDKRPKPKRPDLVAKAIVPDYALGAHTASLGLAYAGATALPPPFANGMFVGQHGSWNRKPRSGYKVIFVPFTSGRPDGMPIDVLTGFVKPNGDAMGRPVGVAIDSRGGLLVADDVGNVIWRVSGVK
jgi:glucose/arabinose dehydrogenase